MGFEEFTTLHNTEQNQTDSTLNIDISTLSSPVLLRLVEEVRNNDASQPHCYDRAHNRHNRS